MADDFFGPASDLAVTTRPAYSPETPRAGHAPSWFKRCTSEGSDDGTAIDAEWLNHLVANLDAVRTAAGVTSSDLAPSSSSVLVTSILRLIANYAGGGGDGTGLTEEQVRDLIAGFVRVSGGLLTKTHDDPGNALTIGLDPALFAGFAPLGVFTAVRFFTASAIWTPADGSNWALLLGSGAGGAGGGVPSNSNNVASCGGGAGEVRLLFLPALAASYSVLIGAGGAGKSNATGGNGGTTQVKQGSTVKLSCGGGRGGTTWVSNVAGAPGGAGSGGWWLGATAGERVYGGDIVGGAGGGNFFGPGAPSTPGRANGIAATTWGGGGSGANGNNNSGQISGVGGAGKGGALMIIEGR